MSYELTDGMMAPFLGPQIFLTTLLLPCFPFFPFLCLIVQSLSFPRSLFIPLPCSLSLLIPLFLVPYHQIHASPSISFNVFELLTAQLIVLFGTVVTDFGKDPWWREYITLGGP